MSITLCETVSCPSASQCFRFTAPRNADEQAEFESDPRKPDGSCDWYLPTPRDYSGHPREHALAAE
jgi:hypothetical protein